MIIELIGCTGAGKSTWLKKLLNQTQELPYAVVTSEVLILQRLHLDWLSNRQLIKLCISLVGITYSLRMLGSHRGLVQFLVEQIRRLPASVSLSERLRIARLVARNLGVYAFIRRNQSSKQVVICDEGTLHIAHYLFVNTVSHPNQGDIRTFCSLIPRPDRAFYFDLPEHILIERTMTRGHKRIKSDLTCATHNFIRHARHVFNHMTSAPEVSAILLHIYGEHQSDQGTPKAILTNSEITALMSNALLEGML